MHSASKPALAGAWILLLLLATSAPAWAQYKWKDSRGQVHVSDLPPPRDIPDKDVLQRPATGQRSANTAVAVPGASVNASTRASASAAPPIRPPVDPELEARRKRADEEAKQRMRTDEERLAAQRAENCQRARQQLAMADSGQRLLRYNERGEPVVIDDAGRADDAQAARRVMASDCR